MLVLAGIMGGLIAGSAGAAPPAEAIGPPPELQDAICAEHRLAPITELADDAFHMIFDCGPHTHRSIVPGR